MISSDSTDLIKFIYKNKITVNIKNKQFLDSLFNIIKSSYKKHNYNILSSKILNNKIDKLQLFDLIKNNIFISDNIKKIISEKIFYIYINYNNVDLHLYLPINDKFEYPKLNRLFHIIDFMRIISKKNTKLTLTIFYTNKKKMLDKEQKVLTYDNVNTGSCYRGKSIFIWRKEEFEKVLIHELIHFYEIDVSKNIIGQSYFRDNYNINEIKLWEAYTDSIAVILHTLFVSFYLNINYIDLLSLEISFILFQAAKLMNYFNIFNISDIKGKFVQITDGFSYYIIKSCLLYFLDDFINLIKNDIYFSDKDDIFLDLIINNIHNIDYEKKLQKYMKIHSLNKNDYIYYTSRMTCLELL